MMVEFASGSVDKLKKDNRHFKIFSLENGEYGLIIENNDLKLPVKVLELLELFIENEKKIISKDKIVDRLWSKSQTHSDGSIRVYINSLKNILKKNRM